MKTKEDILDQCIESIIQGATIEDTLKNYPELKDELEPLLKIGMELSELPSPTLNLEKMMHSMGKAAQTENPKVKKPKLSIFSYPVLLRVAASITVIIMLSWGSIIVSASAVPGDWFYPIKLLTERAIFVLTINSENKAELRIAFSEQRLKEAVKKYEQGDGLDRQLLADMLDEAKKALESVPVLPEESRNYIAARALSSVKLQEERLRQLHKKASPADQKILKTYMDMCKERSGWMQEHKNNPETWSSCNNKTNKKTNNFNNDSCPW